MTLEPDLPGLPDLSDLMRTLGDLPRTDRGRRHGLRASCPPSALTVAANFCDATGLDRTLEEWLRRDRPNREAGIGRPETVTPRAYLIAALACAIAGLPVAFTVIHHTLTSDMPKASRVALGFATSQDPHEDERHDRARQKLSYWSVVRTATKVARTFDPKPYPARRGLTAAEIAGIDAARDPEGVALRQQRADRLQSMLLVGCFAALPRKIRKAWRGDITLDGTVVPIYGKFGHNSKRRLREGARSPEVLSGWHAKERDQRDMANLPGQKPNIDWTHGYDAHIALMTTRADEQPVPPLILALSLDTPGSKPGLNAAAALAGIVDAGLPAGWVTTDLGYSQLLPENFALPVRALGFELMHMFKQDELGVIQASWKGLICVEGTVYGPCLPDVLRNASVDLAAKRIDDQTYLTRIEAHRAYQARVKAGRDGHASYVFRCPGAGPHRTVRCDLKKVPTSQEATEAGKRKTLPLVVNAPSDPPPCCANSASASVPVNVFARYVTALPYKTPEWKWHYRDTRNQMEGKNRFIKNPLDADIASSGERRFRGFGKQLFALLTNSSARTSRPSSGGWTRTTPASTSRPSSAGVVAPSRALTSTGHARPVRRSGSSDQLQPPEPLRTATAMTRARTGHFLRSDGLAWLS